MTDLPSGALASHILVVPKVVFPDVGSAKGIGFCSKEEKTQNACIVLTNKHSNLLHAVQRNFSSTRQTIKQYPDERKMKIYDNEMIPTIPTGF